jgi:uncharacterized OB-fold protein
MAAPTAPSTLSFERPEQPPPFPLPKLNPDNEFFWRSGADGTLRLLRCGQCRYIVHPPAPRCPSCGSDGVSPEAVSGRGTVYSYTIAIQAFLPGLEPYCVAMVEIEEQSDVRIVGLLVGCTSDTVAVGLPVEVDFIQPTDAIWVPCFRVVAAVSDACGANQSNEMRSTIGPSAASDREETA